MTDDQLRERAYRKISIRLVPFLIVCYILAYIDRSNVGMAKIEFLSDLGLSEAVFGIGGGLFYLGYICMEVPSNLMLKRVGARLTMMRIMVLWGLVSASFAWVTEPWHFYILRFLLGAAEAGFFPGVIFFLSCWVPASRRASMTAMFMSAMAISGVIGGPISGAIMQATDGAWGLHGWQWLFILEGLPSSAMGVVAFLYLDNAPGDARWLSVEEKAIIQQDLRDDEQGAVNSGAHASIWDAMRDWQFYTLAAYAAAQMSVIAGLSLWMPTFLRSTGDLSVLQIGMLTAIPYAAAVVFQQLAARRSDRTGERRGHAVVPMLLGGFGYIALAMLGDNLVAAVVLLTFVTAAVFSTTGPFWVMPSQLLSQSAAAPGIALLTTLGSISALVSPMIVGWLADETGGNASGQLYYGALMIVGAGVLWFGSRRTDRARTAPAAR